MRSKISSKPTFESCNSYLHTCDNFDRFVIISCSRYVPVAHQVMPLCSVMVTISNWVFPTTWYVGSSMAPPGTRLYRAPPDRRRPRARLKRKIAGRGYLRTTHGLHAALQCSPRATAVRGSRPRPSGGSCGGLIIISAPLRPCLNSHQRARARAERNQADARGHSFRSYAKKKLWWGSRRILGLASRIIIRTGIVCTRHHTNTLLREEKW